MKTPDEIKNGLAEAPHVKYVVDDPVRDDVHYERYGVAIGYVLRDNIVSYIQRLESHIEELVADNNRLDEIRAKLERERDAAVHDLPIGIDCNTCKYSERAYEEQPCSGCKEYRGPWYPLHWEWRGVCEENTKEDTTDEPT